MIKDPKALEATAAGLCHLEVEVEVGVEKMTTQIKVIHHRTDVVVIIIVGRLINDRMVPINSGEIVMCVANGDTKHANVGLTLIMPLIFKIMVNLDSEETLIQGACLTIRTD